MFSPQLIDDASQLLVLCRSKKLMIASAESCTGGLISGLFTQIAGSSDVFERGFVTYSNEAKSELLGVPMELIDQWGAVSPQVAAAMASGALARSLAGLSISVTGIAGPGGGSKQKPVGLVYLAAARKNGLVIGKTCKFGDIGRSKVREATISAAIKLLNSSIETEDRII
ncbi:MAG: CinA family protein [bacterium]|nr:CinA family protein [bacterium]